MSNISTKEGIYICLEGLKGAGKTTVFEQVVEKIAQTNIEFTTVAPTKAASEDDWIEKLIKKYPLLKEKRLPRVFLYAHRSNYAADHAQWHKPLILGERSLITSYATKRTYKRWKTRWNFKVIDTLEHKIRVPDYVIYIDVSHRVLRERIESRNKARDMDDTPLRLLQMEEAYYEMMHHQPIERIKDVKWLRISGEDPLDVVVENVYDTILRIYESENVRGLQYGS